MAPGDEIKALYLIASASQLQAKNGPFWRLELKDASGDLEARIWSPLSQQFAEIPSGVIAEVEGRAESFRDKLQVNVNALRVLMKKVAETVRNEVSYSTLHNALKGIGFSISKDTLISYLEYAKEAYLLFSISNATAAFVEREGSPKYYYSDNGLLGLFLVNRETALLENEIAVALCDRFGEDLRYLRSSRTGIDVDFYLPEAGIAIQVAYSIAGEAREREVGNLVRLAKVGSSVTRFLIVTKEEEEVIDADGISIEVMPAWKFLLGECGS